MAPPFSPSTVDYSTVIPFKHRLLEKAWTNFTKARSAELSIAFEQFCHEQADWLEDYALFRALKIRYNGAYYLEWPTELIQRLPKALAIRVAGEWILGSGPSIDFLGVTILGCRSSG